ncbi:MAG: hypothetical protein WC082_13860 [Victivallales bacterium]
MSKCARCLKQHHCDGENCRFRPITRNNREDWRLDPDEYAEFIGVDKKDNEVESCVENG